MSGRIHPLFILVPLAMIAGFAFGRLLPSGGPDVELSYAELVEKIDAGEIATAELFEKSLKVEGELQDGNTYAANYPSESTGRIADASPAIEMVINTEDVADSDRSFGLGSLVALVVPLLLLVVALTVVIRSSKKKAS